MVEKTDKIELEKSEIETFDKENIAAYSFASAGACGEPGGVNIMTKDGTLYHFNYVELEMKAWKPNISGFGFRNMGLGNELHFRIEYDEYIEKMLNEHEGEHGFPNAVLYKNWAKWLKELLTVQ